jgi:ribonuclease D
MSEATLLALAQATPTALDELKSIPGMTDGQIRRHGGQLLQAIARGRKAHVPRPPSQERYDSDVLERYETLRRWRKQRAQERGVESDIIIPRDVLWEIALNPPQSPADLEAVAGFGPVRRAKYGEEIIRALREMK